MHKTVLREAAASYPVTIAEIESHLKITDENGYINTLISAATANVETFLNRALVTQEHSLFLDCWEREILIPFPPLVSVDLVRYYDTDGVLTPLVEDDFYWVVTTDAPGRIVQKYDTTYPELQDGRPDSVEIQFTCGYGSSDAVPADIKHAIKMICTDLHEHRGEVSVGQVTRIPNHIMNLLHPYRIYKF